MLAGFRHIAKGLVAKLLLGVLALAFAFWGVGDIFQGPSVNTIATVGDETISQQQLDALIDRLQQSYAQITPELANDPQFRAQALNNLIDNLLLQQESEKLGLTYSRDALATYIGRNPMFRQEDGSFNREMFEALLKQNGWGEREYLKRLADDLRTALLRDTVSAGITPPESMVEAMHAIKEETREARLILLSKPNEKAIKAPDDATLEALYKENPMRFTTPERRTFIYAHFNGEDAWNARKLDPTEEILKQRYEERKADMIEQETREVYQLLFADEDAAQKTHEGLKTKADFDKVANSDAVLNAGSASLGTVHKSDLPPAVVDAVFAMDKQSISKPVKSDFGWHIFYVGEIKPQHELSFAEATERLVADYRAEHAEEEMNNLANSLEDAVAGGADLKDALKQAGLSAVKIGKLESVAADGTKIQQPSAALDDIEKEVVQLGFSLEEGDISPLSLAENGNYFMVSVSGIEASSVQPMADVRPQLLALYQEQNRRDALRKQADHAAEMLKKAENPEAAAKEAGYSLHTSGKLKRMHDTVANPSQLKDKILTSGFVQELFSLNKHETTGAYPLPSGEYIIGILTDIHPAPKPSHEALQLLETELATQLSNDVMELYMAHLNRAYKVEVKPEAIMPQGTGVEE